MSRKIAPLVGLVFIFSACDFFGCHKCLKQGQSLSAPYVDGQILNFESDSGKTASYTVMKIHNDGHKSYCGPLGSGSYDYCMGYTSSRLIFNTDSLFAEFMAYQMGDPGSKIYKEETVDHFDCFEEGYTDLKTLVIGSKTYSKALRFVNANANVGECSSFIYSPVDGLLQFTMRHATGVETWTLTN